MRALSLGLSLLIVGSLASSQSVEVRDGNVFYVPGSGAAPRQLTALGRDTEAVLSPNKRLVAFVRRTPGDTVETALGVDQATELWVIRPDGSGARRLVRGRAADDSRYAIARMDHVSFAPRGDRIYFMSMAWVTSGSLHGVDVRSRKERFITDALEFDVVRAGDYRGDLMVMQHRYFIPRGSYDYTWMFSPAGVELGMIFTDDFNEAQWNAIRDGREYTAPADSSGQAKPPK